MNGIPAAVDIESGSILWKMEATSKAGDDLSHLVGSSYGILDSYLLISLGSDLVVLHKEDGRSLGRLHDMITGNVDLREAYAKTAR